MRIKTRLQIITIVFVVVAVTAGVTFYWTSVQTEIVRREDLMSLSFLKGITELEILTNDYLLHHGKRAQAQWEIKYGNLKDIVVKGKFNRPAEQEIRGKIEHNLEHVKLYFTMLVSDYKKRQGLNSGGKKVNLEKEERLTSLIMLKSREMVSVALLLKENIHAELKDLEQTSFILITIFLIIMTMFIAAALYSIHYTIANPITKLYEGSKIIGSGNLDYRIDTDSNDEIGDLSRAFDKMTEELRSSQKALVQKERLAVLGKLSAGIAHEIKNPLGVIDSSIYYLNMKLNAPDEKILQHLNRIKEQVYIANTIIQSLMNLTKMKEPVKTQIDISDIIEKVIKDSKVPHGIEVIKELPEGELFISADKEQISMAFRNIVLNAAQAMDKHGRLLITAGKTRAGIEISFKDTGPGIAPEDMEKIFQPFFSTKARGIGFGLAICQMVVEKHGGAIEARSEEGKGASLIVRLPGDIINNRG